MVSTTRSYKFMIALISVKKVFGVSSSKPVLCVLRTGESIAQADLICLSHTLPIWLAKGVFIFHCIQSAFCFISNSLILLWSISLMHFVSSFLAPTKFPPLSQQIDLTFPLLAMNRLNTSTSWNQTFSFKFGKGSNQHLVFRSCWQIFRSCFQVFLADLLCLTA